MSDLPGQVNKAVNMVNDTTKQVVDTVTKEVKDVKTHPFRYFIIGISIGILLTGITFGYFYLDASGKSATVIRQLEQRQQSVISIVGQLGDSIKSSQSTSQSIKAIVARDGQIIKALGEVLNVLTTDK